MSSVLNGHIDRLNRIIEDCEVFCFAARDSELQRDACAKLQALAADCGTLKSEAIAAGHEDFANLLLGFECVGDSLRSEITMWLLLKAEKPDEAWDELIAAQMATTGAVRAHKAFSHLEQHADHLEEIEKLVFPPQVYVSAGLVVRHQECSICGSEYGDCEHVAGRPYWGRFCYIIAKDLEPNHMAIVKNPADKRCRIMQFSVDGGYRNRMTWKIEPTENEESTESPPASGPGGAGQAPPERTLRATARLLHSRN